MMEKLNKIICGDSLEVLKTLPAECVNCIVTSPPYYCLRDYGVSGQIGLEKTPEQYIENLVNVFIECHRVLKSDGTMWVVIGDSYAGSTKGKGHRKPSGIQPAASWIGNKITSVNLPGYKNKDLIGIPFMLAFALRKAGWYLRQDIIWAKPNPMPESVKDRCTKAHEYIFIFSKSAKYYFNHAAMLEPARYDNHKNQIKVPSTKYLNGTGTGLQAQTINKGGCRWREVDGQFIRNRRDVWFVPTRGFKEAHFATFPPNLIKPCIEAGCPQNGVVLDVFMGAGTTAVVARELGRNFIGIELNPEYVRIAEKRLEN